MKSSEWFYNEIQQVGVDYEDIEEVEKYDARMHKLRDIRKEIATLTEAVSPTPSSTILEIGCGTGEFSLALAQMCKRICAADISPVMLEYAKRKAKRRRISNIDFTCAGFLTYDGGEEEFDIVISQLALHHLPDFWKTIALKNVKRVLKVGGTFYLKDVVYSSEVDSYSAYFDEIIRNVRKSSGEEFTKEYSQHIRQEHSTLDWIMEGMLRKAGFSVVSESVDEGFVSTYICTST